MRRSPLDEFSVVNFRAHLHASANGRRIKSGGPDFPWSEQTSRRAKPYLHFFLSYRLSRIGRAAPVKPSCGYHGGEAGLLAGARVRRRNFARGVIELALSASRAWSFWWLWWKYCWPARPWPFGRRWRRHGDRARRHLFRAVTSSSFRSSSPRR